METTDNKSSFSFVKRGDVPQTLQVCFHVGSKGFKYTDSPTAYWPGSHRSPQAKQSLPHRLFPGGHHYKLVVRVCWTQVYLLLPPSSQCNEPRTKRMNCSEGGFCSHWLLVGGEIYEGVFNLPDGKCESVANSIVPIFSHLKNIVPVRHTEDINSCIVGKPTQLFSITHNDTGIWFQNRCTGNLGKKGRVEKKKWSERRLSDVGSQYLEDGWDEVTAKYLSRI